MNIQSHTTTHEWENRPCAHLYLPTLRKKKHIDRAVPFKNSEKKVGYIKYFADEFILINIRD